MHLDNIKVLQCPQVVTSETQICLPPICDFHVLRQPESQGFVQIYCVVSHSLRVECKQNDYFQLCTSPLHLSARILFFKILPCGLFKSMTYLFLLFSMCYSHYCINFDEKLSQIQLLEVFPHLVHGAFLCLHNCYAFISYFLENRLRTLYMLDNHYPTDLQPYPTPFPISFSLTPFFLLSFFQVQGQFPRALFVLPQYQSALVALEENGEYKLGYGWELSNSGKLSLFFCCTFFPQLLMMTVTLRGSFSLAYPNEKSSVFSCKKIFYIPRNGILVYKLFTTLIIFLFFLLSFLFLLFLSSSLHCQS